MLKNYAGVDNIKFDWRTLTREHVKNRCELIIDYQPYLLGASVTSVGFLSRQVFINMERRRARSSPARISSFWVAGGARVIRAVNRLVTRRFAFQMEIVLTTLDQ